MDRLERAGQIAGYTVVMQADAQTLDVAGDHLYVAVSLIVLSSLVYSMLVGIL